MIDNGSATANELRTFLDENKVDLAELINKLVTTGEVVVRHLDGVEQILVIYPYVVEGGFTVVSKSPDTGLYDAHFGMILTQDPEVCHARLRATDRRPPQDGGDRPMNTNAHCAEPARRATPAARRTRPARARRTGAPVVASYDPDTGKLTWGDKVNRVTCPRPARWPRNPGRGSWKWLFLQPLTEH